MASVTKIRLQIGDRVIVRSGRDKGKTGRVIATHPRLNKVTVEGINLVKRHQKPTRQQPQGGVLELTQPIWVSKLGLYQASGKSPKRVAYKLAQDGRKSRVYAGTTTEVKVRVPKGAKS